LKWIRRHLSAVAVTFDLYSTLVTADRPDEPWTAVAVALDERGVSVPDTWESAYRSGHVDAEPLEEISLVEHTITALKSRGVNADPAVVRKSLLAAFDGPVTVADGAREAVEAAAARGPVGVLSNCSLPGLVAATLARTEFDSAFDAIVTSVGCGWRKPHDRAFQAAATALGVDADQLVHVGDDPRADGGGRTAGVTVVLTAETPLAAFPAWLEDRR
jgi:HAD superfamily hydrolase (TIGR01509 family)